MATPLQHRRGNTTATQSFLGLQGELFINTDNNQLFIQDGANTGGWPVATGSGYTPNGLLMANATGSIQNTSVLQFVTANNSVVANSSLTVTGNLSVLGTTTTVNQQVINTTEVVAGQLTANSGTGSTSTTTGALLVSGGAGITGNVYANGVSSNTLSATSITTANVLINQVPAATVNQAILYSMILG
jgi:hypothetical protein